MLHTLLTISWHVDIIIHPRCRCVINPTRTWSERTLHGKGFGRGEQDRRWWDAPDPSLNSVGQPTAILASVIPLPLLDALVHTAMLTSAWEL